MGASAGARCTVGHAFTATPLVAQQSEALEESLWSAFRALQESAALARKMVARARQRNQGTSADLFAEQATEADARAEIIRQVLAARGTPGR